MIETRQARMSRLEALVREHLLRDEDPGTVALIRRLAPARRRGYLTKGEMVAVCRWKSARALPLVRSNDPRRIRRATAAALASRSEHRRLEALLTLRGVSIPMASAALTLLNPRRYGVLDIRVWQLLHREGAVERNRAGTGFTCDHWSQFLGLIRPLADRLRVPARAIERTLFAVHEMRQKGPLYRRPATGGTRVGAGIGALLLLASLVAGCDSAFQSDDYRDRLSSVGSVTAPDTVAVGASFDIVIVTWGSNGCWRKGHDLVDRSDSQRISIRPFDREYTGSGACTTALVYFQHLVSARAARQGPFDVTVYTRLLAVSGKDSIATIHVTVEAR